MLLQDYLLLLVLWWWGEVAAPGEFLSEEAELEVREMAALTVASTGSSWE